MAATGSEKARSEVWRLQPPLQLAPVVQWAQTKRVDRVQMALLLQRDGSRVALEEPSSVHSLAPFLEPRLLAAWLSNSWPGIKYQEPLCGLVLEFEAASDLLAAMVAIGPRFSDWHYGGRPALPEDLCFYRSGDALPAVFSVTHEREVYLLDTSKPDLPVAWEGEFDPSELIVAVGRPSFRPNDSVELSPVDLERLRRLGPGEQFFIGE